MEPVNLPYAKIIEGLLILDRPPTPHPRRIEIQKEMTFPDHDCLTAFFFLHTEGLNNEALATASDGLLLTELHIIIKDLKATTEILTTDLLLAAIKNH